jgi:hypothetical protein
MQMPRVCYRVQTITCLLQVKDLDMVIKGLAADDNVMLQEC